MSRRPSPFGRSPFRPSMDRDRFEALVSEALDEIPKKFRKLIDNVNVMVEDDCPRGRTSSASTTASPTLTAAPPRTATMLPTSSSSTSAPSNRSRGPTRRSRTTSATRSSTRSATISASARPNCGRSSAPSGKCAKEKRIEQAARRPLCRADDALQGRRDLSLEAQGERPQAQPDRRRGIPGPRVDRGKRIPDERGVARARRGRSRSRVPAKKVLVGTARESTKGTIDFTASLPARGIAAVLVRPPSYFKSKMTREALKAHYLAVADASRYPVLVYNMPQNTGISLEPRLVIDLASHRNIAGLKESGGSLAFLAEVVREVHAGFHYLLGSGSVVYPGLEMGACGAILAVANAAPEMCAELFRLFKAGEKDKARNLQLDLVPLNKVLVEVYGIAGLKHAQDLRGYYGGPTRLPLLPVDEKGRAEIAAANKGRVSSCFSRCVSRKPRNTLIKILRRNPLRVSPGDFCASARCASYGYRPCTLLRQHPPCVSRAAGSGEVDCRTRTVPLPLLPSGPDGVRGKPFAQDPSLQRHVQGHRPERGKPRQGIRPHLSGLWATGHR